MRFGRADPCRTDADDELVQPRGQLLYVAVTDECRQRRIGQRPVAQHTKCEGEDKRGQQCQRPAAMRHEQGEQRQEDVEVPLDRHRPVDRIEQGNQPGHDVLHERDVRDQDARRDPLELPEPGERDRQDQKLQPVRRQHPAAAVDPELFQRRQRPALERRAMKRHAQQESRQHEEQIDAEVAALEQRREVEGESADRQDQRGSARELPTVKCQHPDGGEAAHPGEVGQVRRGTARRGVRHCVRRGSGGAL